ncbi:translation initiation factor IF-2-like [Nycticebus coucang]|uniref:translation initiation factor IF-2-like n=1 Tax=Nycticebus coucang TaxID=9470 RepID=UPI00234D5FB0|nr:translation initiation factor IF-2-like [Nycticebus coucang]
MGEEELISLGLCQPLVARGNQCGYRPGLPSKQAPGERGALPAPTRPEAGSARARFWSLLAVLPLPCLLDEPQIRPVVDRGGLGWGALRGVGGAGDPEPWSDSGRRSSWRPNPSPGPRRGRSGAAPAACEGLTRRSGGRVRLLPLRRREGGVQSWWGRDGCSRAASGRLAAQARGAGAGLRGGRPLGGRGPEGAGASTPGACRQADIYLLPRRPLSPMGKLRARESEELSSHCDPVAKYPEISSERPSQISSPEP